jgi:AbrB family looped-hinge helix DNA binding protein
MDKPAIMLPSWQQEPYMAKNWARVEQNGRILLPAALREQLGIKPGDEVLLRVVDGGVLVTTPAAAVRRVQEQLRKWVPEGALVSNDILAMRRAEVEREEARDRGGCE